VELVKVIYTILWNYKIEYEKIQYLNTAAPQYCSDSTFACQNGGTCQNLTVSADVILGYKCTCPSGYEGFLCDKSNLILCLIIINKNFIEIN